ncbi:MAG: endolytic transglycosylase MltG [Rhodospirillaceae bacterium]|nr:endolytic transglycosylase MltG [Rhodospirillaceae bacterium]
MARKFLRFLILVVALGSIAAGAFVWGAGQYQRPGPSTHETIVVIPSGAGVERIANILVTMGVIDDALIFRLGVRLSGADTALRAGEYAFPAAVSAGGAVAVLQSGKPVARRLTIPEGLTSAEALLLISDAVGMTGDIALPAEGTLLPETYHYSYGDSRLDLVRRMTGAMDETLARLWAEKAGDSPIKTPAEALVLASIVEKETAIANERPHIAGVFINRLKRGMRLQSDPTVVFGLTGGAGALGRSLSRDDLKKPHPYNTYMIKGLPPGPICNPGIDAIAAVLNPMATEDLYFVADGSGGHVFSKTLKEHNRNVAKWRKIRDAAGG